MEKYFDSIKKSTVKEVNPLKQGLKHSEEKEKLKKN